MKRPSWIGARSAAAINDRPRRLSQRTTANHSLTSIARLLGAIPLPPADRAHGAPPGAVGGRRPGITLGGRGDLRVHGRGGGVWRAPTTARQMAPISRPRRTHGGVRRGGPVSAVQAPKTSSGVGSGEPAPAARRIGTGLQACSVDGRRRQTWQLRSAAETCRGRSGAAVIVDPRDPQTVSNRRRWGISGSCDARARRVQDDPTAGGYVAAPGATPRRRHDHRLHPASGSLRPSRSVR